MASIIEMRERLAALEKQGKSTNALRKKQDHELQEYENDLLDFSSELEILANSAEDQEAYHHIKAGAQLLKDRLDAEKHHRSWRGKLGFKQSKTSTKDEKPKKTASQASKEELERFNQELQKIQAQRAANVTAHYEPNQFSSESKGILTSAIDEFRHALVPPLLDSDITELRRKRDALDAAKAIQQVYKLDGKNIQGTLEKMKRVSAGAASVFGEFVEESTGGVLKATSLFLAWPLILPIKALNQVFTGAKYAFSFADGALGFFDKGLDGIIGKLERTEAGKIKPTPENIVKSIAHTILRGPILLLRGLCQVAAIGCRWLQKNIDADRWLKRTPVTAGFAIGGVGAVVLIGLALASIPGLGIPIAVAAVAFAVATVGALIQGYFKAKEKAKELSKLELSPSEANQLEKYEYEHRHKPHITQNPKANATHDPLEDEPSTKAKEHPKAKAASDDFQSKKHSSAHLDEESEKAAHSSAHKRKHREEEADPGQNERRAAHTSLIHPKTERAHPRSHKSHKLHHFNSHKEKHKKTKGDVEGGLSHSHHSHRSSKKRRHE